MPQETKTQKKGGPSTTSTSEEIATKVPDEDIEEIDIPQNKTIMDRLQMVMEKFAHTGMGQMALEGCDRVLKVLEETAKWSVPQDDNDHIKLERPLPWIFFIPLIVWLRVLRFWLTIGSVMMGGSPVTSQNMVYNVQVKRRRLRAIRVPALRATRRLAESGGQTSTTNKTQNTLIGKIRSLFGSAVCRPGLSCDSPASKAFEKTYLSQILNDSSADRSSSKRPRDDENSDLNMTVQEMLNKYANEDSEDDEDYIPQEEDEESDASTSSSESIASSEQNEMAETLENLQASRQKEQSKMAPQNSAQSEKTSSLDRSVVEVKENGNTHHRPMPKPISDIKVEVNSDADSGSEKLKTPTGPTNKTTNSPMTNKSTEVAKNQESKSETTNPKESTTITPKQQSQQPMKHTLSVAQESETKQKSTPGHESAASLNAASGVKSAIGSPQHFHTIFQPASLIKPNPVDAHSTPKDAAESNTSPVVEDSDAFTKKNLNKPQHHPMHHQQQHYNHNKNRNKNRR
ncbi:jabba isoform X2 [Haematobia irritans]|uniref:jabba isoform X2 n=1 Tax=Haematobia irritans TaxID=7368 RepID=UPI003F4F9EA3